MYENSEENIGWLRYLFDFTKKDFCTMDTLTDESQGDKLIEEFKQGKCNLSCEFLQTSPEEQKNPMFDQQPTNKQSSSEKPPTNCSNEENSSMCGQIIKTEKMTTSKQGLQVLLIAPLLALAATQNKHIPLFLNNQEDKSAFLQGIDMTLGKQGPVDDHTDLQTDKETINKMMFLKRGKKDPDEGIIKGSMSLKQQTKEPEEYSNHFKHLSMLPSDYTDNSDTVSSSNSLVDDHTNLQTDKETINEMMFFPDLDYLYEGTVQWECTQASGPKIFPDQESLDEETQVFTDVPWEYAQASGPQIFPDLDSLDEETQVCTHIPWEYTQDLGPQIIPDQESLDEENQVFTQVPELIIRYPELFAVGDSAINYPKQILKTDHDLMFVLEDLVMCNNFPNVSYCCLEIEPKCESGSEHFVQIYTVAHDSTKDLVQFLSLGSIDSVASSKKCSFNVYHHDRHPRELIQSEDEYDLHQCDLVQREDEDVIIQHPSLNFSQLDDQKTGKQLSNHDENFGKLYQKFSHLVTQMAMEDRKEVDLEMNCLSIDSKKVVFLL